MRYSNQKWFCNNCGKEQNTPLTVGRPGAIGREWKCCSMKCHEEIEWKYALSILGKEYYPKPEEKNGEKSKY